MKNNYRILFHGTDLNRFEVPVVIATCKSYKDVQEVMGQLLDSTDMILSFR